MIQRVVFRLRAQAELLEARAWYDDQRLGLGERFATAVETTIEQVAQTPLAYAVVHDQVRRAVVRRFPYTVYFQVFPEYIVVLAVMHGSRDPRRWQSRR